MPINGWLDLSTNCTNKWKYVNSSRQIPQFFFRQIVIWHFFCAKFGVDKSWVDTLPFDKLLPTPFFNLNLRMVLEKTPITSLPPTLKEGRVPHLERQDSYFVKRARSSLSTKRSGALPLWTMIFLSALPSVADR